jgi:uncharacterized protein YggE
MPENEKNKHICSGPLCWITHPKKYFKFLMLLIFIAGLGVALSFAIPYKQEMTPKFITVVGSSTGTTKNKSASYSFTVTSRNSEKRIAVSESRDKNDVIVSKFKTLGIAEDDFKTMSENTYQEIIYKDGVRQGQGDWISSITTSIKLRDLNSEPSVSEILADPSIENSWGPDFSVSNVDINEETLLAAALDDAEAKATALAAKVGRRLITVVNVTEGYSTGNVFYGKMAEGMGGGAGVAPGVTETSKIVTVTYLIR